MYYTLKDTPAGKLLLLGDNEQFHGIFWEVYKKTPVLQDSWIEDANKFKPLLAQLDEYFTGDRQTFSLPTNVRGTAFQKAVWQEIAKIPFGGKTSYQGIAEAIGRPKAVRAVGTAVGSNPLSIIVPCHRVLTSTGSLGGYAGGLDAKKTLLAIENIHYK